MCQCIACASSPLATITESTLGYQRFKGLENIRQNQSMYQFACRNSVDVLHGSVLVSTMPMREYYPNIEYALYKCVDKWVLC